MSNITVRFAEGDSDVITIHGFLCVVAGPMLPGPIGPAPSATEVWRVVNHECAMVAIRDGKIVGTIGIIKAKFWWSDDLHFLANRWFHSLPGEGIGKLLLDEAERFAIGLGLELHIIDETKGRLLILNKSPLRQAVNPIFARPPVPPTHPVHPTQQ
jgi:hypothetical protein